MKDKKKAFLWSPYFPWESLKAKSGKKKDRLGASHCGMRPDGVEGMYILIIWHIKGGAGE